MKLSGKKLQILTNFWANVVVILCQALNFFPNECPDKKKVQDKITVEKPS